MEADWEFEIGAGAPVIEAYWNGFVDLRSEPKRISALSECLGLPGLAESLLQLNGAASPVWTSKSDVFTPEHIDPDEMDASIEESAYAIACYIDVLLRSDQIWNHAIRAERDCKRLCARLREVVLRRCRIDVVIRKAVMADLNSLGATIYFTACGSTIAESKTRLGECLRAFTSAVAPLG